MSGGKVLLEEWFRRVWIEEDETAIDEMFLPTGKAAGLGAHLLIGPDDFKPFHAAICKQLKDIEITIDRCLEDGSWISAMCTFRANSAKDETPVSITGSTFCLIEKGKIVEAYNFWDFMGLWAQLGYLPSDGFERGLRGVSLID